MASKNKKKRNNKRSNKKNKYKKEEQFVKEPGSVQEDADEEPQTSGPNNEGHKRKYSDDDSDADVPKKKKKKQPVVTNISNQKGKKSIRQMKREKHAQRQAEAQAASKDELKSQCVNYLSQWKHDRQNWKFMKAKQVWLYKNKFSSHLVPDSSWQTLLEYFESAQGNIRNMLLEDANKVIKKMDEWIESQNNRDEKDKPTDDGTEESEVVDDAPESEKPDDTSYKRARDIIQCLQE